MPLADGTHAEREVVVHRGAVALVPMVDDQHVCLVENHRYSVGKTLLEVPAGTIDQGESPEQTADARAPRGDRLSRGQHPPAPRLVRFAGCDDRAHVSVPVRGSRSRPAHLELDERLKTVIVPWNEALAMVDDGTDRRCQDHARLDDLRSAQAATNRVRPAKRINGEFRRPPASINN